jgi:ribosomal protein S18 acetylase RimI-like enzyme
MTSPGPYTIRQATLADLDALIGLRRYAETWLHAAGIEQWTDHARGAHVIRAGLNDGVTHAVTDPAGAIVASLTLNGADPDFWTPEDDPDSALYLYKFMIGPEGRGTGLGDALLDWAGDQAQQRGKQWLRLDCWRTNTGLQAYYAQRGFELLRVVELSWRSSGALMQRPAEMRTSTGDVEIAACTAT